MSDQIAWKPSAKYLEGSNIAQFIDMYGYENNFDLIPESNAELASIWGDMAQDVGIVWREAYDDVVDMSEGPEFAKWFSGGRLNALETILDQWVKETPDQVMYVWENEEGAKETLTYEEVAHRTDKLANALLEHGIEQGDTVGIIFPMHPNGFIASLACLRIGAIFTQIFPGYGAEAIGQRLDGSEAELIICADGYIRSGSEINLLTKIDKAISYAPAVTDVLVYNYREIATDIESAMVHDWTEFLNDQEPTAETVVVDADDTAFIAYSSGTTGEPKGTIHTHASLLMMGSKEARYQFDITERDTLMWVTDFGWVIVPLWMVAGAPAMGATTVLLEGGPAHPKEDRVWSAIEKYDVTAFGISPSGARGLKQMDKTPRDTHDLSSLNVLASTGEPWDNEGWNWYFEEVGGSEVPIINASGGTELCGAILSPTPIAPLKPGTLYGPAPGVAANIYDESGTPANKGYLVVELPIPGMTHSLTTGDDRYIEEYWSDFDGVWNQNDWTVRDEDGFWFITGRADDTMNIAGRRITAPEIEEVVAGHPNVGETTVIPKPDPTKGQVPVVFVTAISEVDAEKISKSISELITKELGAPFRPAEVHVVPGLPRTQTGKIPREVIESAYMGEEIESTGTLEGAEYLKSLFDTGG